MCYDALKYLYSNIWIVSTPPNPKQTKNTPKSLALRITDSIKEVFDIICIFRSPNWSKEEYILLQQLNKVPFTSDNSENIIMVEDFNLPNVDWVNGLLVSPVNSISQYSRIQNKYLDLLTTKRFLWFIGEYTKCKLEENRLDKTTLDKVFSNNKCLIGMVSLPLGKSKHACIEKEVKVKLEVNYF